MKGRKDQPKRDARLAQWLREAFAAEDRIAKGREHLFAPLDAEPDRVRRATCRPAGLRYRDGQPRPGAQAARRGARVATKQARRRQRLIAAGCCPHCGKPCAPYFECEARRQAKRDWHRKRAA